MTSTTSSHAPIMTVLEAEVPVERWNELTELYRNAGTWIPPQMLHAFLAQDLSEPTKWRSLAVWRSWEALEEYRRTARTPTGLAMFRAVGAEPAVGLWSVGAIVPPARRP